MAFSFSHSYSSRRSSERPGIESRPADPDRPTILEVKNLTVCWPAQLSPFKQTGPSIKAIDDVSFSVRKGEVLGIIGESGSGKTTLARAIVRLAPITSGQILIDGVDWTKLSFRELRKWRRKVQMIFQDPYLSLDPKMTIQEAVQEALDIHFPQLTREERFQTIVDALDAVGLPASILTRYPHELSGGQRQRVAIARALVVEPQILICDEPTSALDVSVQAQILNLLDELRRTRQLTYLFISHDLPAVSYLADRIAVMYSGCLVEVGPTHSIINNAVHPYTQILIQSIKNEQSNASITEEPLPSAHPSPALGCQYFPRCPKRIVGLCNKTRPPMKVIGPDHLAECHLIERSIIRYDRNSPGQFA